MPLRCTGLRPARDETASPIAVTPTRLTAVVSRLLVERRNPRAHTNAAPTDAAATPLGFVEENKKTPSGIDVAKTARV